MFKKILIANRGEIACRVIRTAQRMGIATVAVYSDADRNAPFVSLADEAVHIGPAAASESYLVAEKIIAAAKETGAEAVHPGYGFLSERASFVEQLNKEGLTFIGPPANAIAAMGDKIESKKLAKAAGVNTVPGSPEAIESTDDALKWANDIGYPVMMKASAGGGGKGMRLAWNDTDVREGFEATRREGKNSFGDDRVFVEKFIEDPRHIEIQVLGDKHGTILYLNERECSIQRRHQKVVEEAPSPFVTPKMRKAMGEQSVALARAVDYHSAGTVELIVSGADESGESFYFLEMNTRLQVEHPVTEAITGIDLVEQMIRVAAGQKLDMAQDDIGINGWAIENRVYAEDPYRGFLPSTGRLVHYQPPEAHAHQAPPQPGKQSDPYIRVDDGVMEGGEVSIFYDPMIAKLVSWAPTRDEAADLQVQALDEFRIEGLGHNIDFLSAIMQHPRFRKGALTTGFIEEEYPDGFAGAAPAPELLPRLAAIGGTIAAIEADRARRISGQLDGPLPPPGEWNVRLGDTEYDVSLEETGITVNGEPVDIAMRYTPGDRVVSVDVFDPARSEAVEDAVPAASYGMQIVRNATGMRLTTQGAAHDLRVLPASIAALTQHMIEKEPPDLSRLLICPMPGLLVKLHVGEGEEVQPGQPLATVEAMKMENILRAEKAATVSKVNAEEGESLAVDAIILELE
ncbi:Acetyl-CoA carboxylase [Alteripontixanthobacter maritimus]|uniref:propionyl-CoA carboxylase n=1 Tax=Alteripontixanthobacter maritimus TaxID=2161824 RepID=A0A369Q432_9SPHN|nr:acetyl/propionyl/methylcrotonyl-CoA carboxylase subunit alpha [Alteripontixanthobacter maritimus]RDC59643.1 Acetyl-CoA carboxylase [Alteripontixanthobacter maritimus]